MPVLPGLLLAALIAGPPATARAMTDGEIERVITEEIQELLPFNGAGGVSVAVRIDGRTLFFNQGWADLARNRPMTSDSLFNLASLSKIFDATLLALLIEQGEVTFDDPIAASIAELRRGGDIRDVTLGHLVTYTSGLTMPQDHPPWPAARYTLPKFLRFLVGWKRDKDHRLGRDYIYSHAGFMLLHVALERRLGIPYIDLLQQRVIQPLGLTATLLPLRRPGNVAKLPPALKQRAVQGYYGVGIASDKPGNMQGYYYWPGTGQMFSTARDLATLLELHLGEGASGGALRAAARRAQQGVVDGRPGAGVRQAYALEVHDGEQITIVDKNGALSNTSNYFGMIPSRRLGLVILTNRGDQPADDVGRRILKRLALPASAAIPAED